MGQKKKHNAWWYLRVLLAGGLILSAALFVNRDWNSDVNIKKSVLRYMRHKYRASGTKFQVLSEPHRADVYMDWQHDYWDLNLKLDNSVMTEEERNLTVDVTYEAKKKEITDDFTSFLYRKEIEKAYQEIFDEVYGKGNYFAAAKTNPGMQDGKAIRELLLPEQYLDRVDCNAFLLVTKTSDAQRESDAGHLVDLLHQRNWGIRLKVWYVSEATWKTIEENSLRNTTFQDDYPSKSYGYIGIQQYDPVDKADIYWRRGGD